MNQKAEKSLNEISKLLSGGYALKNLDENSTLADAVVSEIFFDLKESNKSLYFQITYYTDYDIFKIQHFRSYEIPINEIDETSIEIFDNSLPFLGGEYSDFSFSSKYNNLSAFKFSGTKLNEENELEENMSKTGYINFPLKRHVARKLKKHLIIFTKNFRS